MALTKYQETKFLEFWRDVDATLIENSDPPSTNGEVEYCRFYRATPDVDTAVRSILWARAARGILNDARDRRKVNVRQG